MKTYSLVRMDVLTYRQRAKRLASGTYRYLVATSIRLLYGIVYNIFINLTRLKSKRTHCVDVAQIS